MPDTRRESVIMTHQYVLIVIGLTLTFVGLALMAIAPRTDQYVLIAIGLPLTFVGFALMAIAPRI